MSLPDIEAYIEQKIPSEPVTQELMTALPRPERPKPAAGEDDGDSIGEIFREVREARAAEDAKRGGGRGRGERSGGRGERSGSGERRPSTGSGQARRGPRKPRPPRAEGEVPAVATPAAQPQAAAPANAANVATPEGERPARKRRRRRGGRRIEGQDAAAPQVNGTAATPAPAAKATPAPSVATPADKPSLLGRIGRGLKSLVTRSPNRQH